MSYFKRMNEITEELAIQLPEKQLEALLRSGVRIKHKSLKQLLAENGHETLVVAPCFDWGEPVEGETW